MTTEQLRRTIDAQLKLLELTPTESVQAIRIATDLFTLYRKLKTQDEWEYTLTA